MSIHPLKGLRPSLVVACLVNGFTGFAAVQEAEAIPLFANRHHTTCNTCHSIPPKLNANGWAYAANGYRLPPGVAESRETEGPKTKRALESIPFTTWITARYEDKSEDDVSDLFLPKVELVAGGPLGERLSYFAEWRIVSESLRGDGSFQDRGGRFEDLYLEWAFAGEHALKVGQYRSLNQVDVSRRLSTSEPLLFGNGLQTDTDPDPRLNSLMRFSPSSRSPSIGYSFRSIRGQRSSDGLFHHLTVPFVGELSIPLSDEASDEASFELQGPPKGVFLETYYRKGLSSIGVHAFYDDDAWLATALGTLSWRRDFFLTAGVGVDDRDELDSRERYSLEVEYLQSRRDRFRPGFGLRVEDVTDDGRDTAYVPYLVLSGPQSKHNWLLQIQYRAQDDNESLVIDLSAMF